MTVKCELIEIVDDLYGIAPRIRGAGFYRVYYNRRLNRYEVHDTHGLACVLPYDNLDDRSYLHVMATRRQNADEIFASIT